jgi:tetratricopeptide (TPR) repeat protein
MIHRIALFRNQIKPIPGAIGDLRLAVEKADGIVQRICPANSKLTEAVDPLRVPLAIAEGRRNDALRILNRLIAGCQNGSDLLIVRGDLLLSLGNAESAMADFELALLVSPNSERARRGIASAREVLSREVDFYEVLGLTHQASDGEVRDAYKRAAREWHPDRFSDPVRKREAERRMKTLNRALEVLGNAKKRELYDQGRDPETGKWRTDARQRSSHPAGSPLEQLFAASADANPAQWYASAYGL